MSAQDRLDRRAAKHGLGSDERKRKIQKAKDFFSKPVPTYSKDELRKMGHPVETTDAEVKKKQDFLDRLRGKPPVKAQKEGRFDIAIPAPKGSSKNTDKQVAAKAARRAARRAKNDTTKIDKAVTKDKARSANAQGGNTRKYDSIRKNYQTGKSGAYFSKYESTAEYGKSMDRIRDKEKNAAIKPKDRETLGKLADLMKKQKRNEAYRKPTQAEIDADKRKDGKSKDPSTRYKDMKKKMYGNAMGGLKNEEKMYSVKYTHPTDKKSGKTTGPLSKAAADKKAAMGNRVDRVGGKYTVIPHVEAAGQEFTAVPIKTGDVSQADRLTIAKMDAIMKKRSKDKRQKESVELEEALQHVHTIKIDGNAPNNPKPFEVREIKDDFKTHVQAVRSAIKSKGGLVTDTETPSKSNNYVGWIMVGTRGDASKIDAKSIEKAVKRHGVEIHAYQFESVEDASKLSNSAIQKAVKRKGTEIQNSQFMGESSLPPHLQKIIGKNGQIDKKKVDQHVHGKKTKVTDVTPKGYGPKEDVDEATMADRTVLRAVRIAKDMAGNHTGASKRIEKMKKGLSDHPKVKDALRLANESVATADKKPQNFRDPETGKLKVRMVPVDRDVVRGNDAAKSVARKKRFKHMRKEQMATGNSRVGKDGRDAFMKAFKDIQKTAAEIQKKKDADKK